MQNWVKYDDEPKEGFNAMGDQVDNSMILWLNQIKRMYISFPTRGILLLFFVYFSSEFLTF